MEKTDMALAWQNLKWRPSQLAMAAALTLAACAPTAHTAGTVGGGSETMIAVAHEARDAGDLPAALRMYQRAHVLEPEATMPVMHIARTFHDMGAFRDAGDAWAKVLHLEPKNPEALRGYGDTLNALEQPLLALEQYRRAAAFGGENAALLNAMGVAYDKLGNAAKAQETYRAGLAMAPGDMRLTNNLALSLALSADYDEAIRLLETLVADPAADIRHRQNLALAYGLAGFVDRAADVGRQDLDDVSVWRNQAFYATVRELPDHAAKVAALSAHASRQRTSSGVPTQDASLAR